MRLNRATVRMLQAFARAYCEMNEVEGISAAASSDPRLYRPSNPDVAEVLTFSLIMLHTDAHNPNIKKEKKMTMQQFVSNNRFACRFIVFGDDCLIQTNCAVVKFTAALTAERTFPVTSWNICTLQP